MAQKKKKTTTTTKTKSLRERFSLSKKQRVILGLFLLFLGLAMLLAFVSFLLDWKSDQSIVGHIENRDLEAKNWFSKFGVEISHFFVYQGFGVASFYLAVLTFLTGFYLFLGISLQKLKSFWFWGTSMMLWLSVVFGFLGEENPILGGVVGYEMNDFLQDYLGFAGTLFLLLFLVIVYMIIRLNVTPDKLGNYIKRTKKEIKTDLNTVSTTTNAESENVQTSEKPTEEELIAEFLNVKEEEKPQEEITLNAKESTFSEEQKIFPTSEKIIIKNDDDVTDVAMEVETVKEEEEAPETLSEKLVKDFGEFDPTLELSNYRFPTIDLLKDYTEGGSITIDQKELEENKDNIVNTLKNYKIDIAQIKATVGPTVTLYEIVPAAGIRISKIKNLEDDIALSLSALGIRIIAPIPGKGTIGIEVPNKKANIVSMRSVVASSKFQKAEMELPIAMGKTISNETYVIDLAKMPHLLMAGATGQGKSVGLNAILTSLLYAKHPAEVKFVLVDPKKVELTLFNKIERHYLAKLPDAEEAIITDNTKVINTLNSLCIEMDQRYDLLKNAMVRNIKEYNQKFKARKLNPEEGHRFLPYIVLVVDEFADLIMTAGKEVETPIARLAQLARAIGIHLIIATQRPSVNVITGMIKANFPARIAFRVTSKIDSRTILDAGGAEQLIGRGDMLYTQGNNLTRLQCAFVDTPEVEKITEYIGSQKAYPDALLLPEYVGEESGTGVDIDISERDKLFKDAAEIIVTAQQGSASLLQRKLKLGYNRAGRIIDQLEAAGIVGPFEGSKARQVLVPDLIALEELLNNE
ncbi:FtsK/SpoIIIE family DNA translocase [Mesonia hippocampi]|nr:DNA translocase FtsK [Mesonia hippocampi]